MLKITSTEKKGKYFWKYESKFGRSITNAKSSISQSVKAWAWFTGSYKNNNLPPTPNPPPTPIQTFTSGQILFVTEDTAVTEV